MPGKNIVKTDSRRIVVPYFSDLALHFRDIAPPGHSKLDSSHKRSAPQHFDDA
jgi:hypothetical protein